jgi:hypothetical protein
MSVRKLPFRTVCLVLCVSAGLSFAAAKKEKHAKEDAAATSEKAVLWTDPADIASRDLFYGPGGSGHVPQGPFKFDKEDLDGTNPKFTVKDKDGVKWKVKLGIEARPETVATRIVWAVGYHANEDYFLPELQVDGMPARLHRGQKLIGPNGTMQNVRLKREDEKKAGNWRWREDPFSGTRELNGLRTLMAVINNWDLKDENNSVYTADGQRIFMVSDLGASFGCNDRCLPPDRAKGDVKTYQHSRFIRRIKKDTVSFETPAWPAYLYVFSIKEYVTRVRLGWIGSDIPRADAKWMGTLLARLSPQQIHDAFRAAGYSPQDCDEFSKVMATRISALTDL